MQSTTCGPLRWSRQHQGRDYLVVRAPATHINAGGTPSPPGTRTGGACRDYNPGSSSQPPCVEHRAMPFSEPTDASGPRRRWLLLAVLLPLLCLAGCAARTSRGPDTDRARAPSPSPTLPVATFTPGPIPSPTFTPTPTPTLLPTPTSTPTLTGPATPTPSLTRSGAYDNLTEHPDGRYALQRSGSRVAATFAASRSPVAYWAREVPPPLFTVPESFRPPYPVLRSAEGTPVLADGASDPDHPEPRRFLLRVDPDGTMRYADDNHAEGVGYLAYALDTVWGTTPAANDRAVLEILDAHWFRKTLLSAEPPPEQFEVPAREMRMGDVSETIPAARLGAFVTFDTDGRVTALGAPTRAIGSDEESSGYHFHGPLLPELGQLHRLEHLDLGYRQIEVHPGGWTRRQRAAASLDQDGSIPTDMGALTGAIPPQLGQLVRLRYLDLQGQLLAGPLPPEMGHLASLEYLDLGGNGLAGPLPPELGRLSRLRTLNLSFNQLTALPSELGQLANLQILNLRSNRLTALPPELGQLTNLQTLDLSGNRLIAFPPELGQLTSLRTLYLLNSQLTGTLPSEWGQLANLEHLSLEDNQLTGPLPSEWGQLVRLERLFLMNNQLTGPLPPEWGRLANLQRLDLYNNQLTGPLPSEWGQLARLEHLYLHKNQLSGSLPPTWGQLARLQWLYLYSNQLTGSLPPAWGQLARLRRLDLEDNQLTGPLPLEWTRMSSLQHLNLWHNQLGPVDTMG